MWFIEMFFCDRSSVGAMIYHLDCTATYYLPPPPPPPCKCIYQTMLQLTYLLYYNHLQFTPTIQVIPIFVYV